MACFPEAGWKGGPEAGRIVGFPGEDAAVGRPVRGSRITRRRYHSRRRGHNRKDGQARRALRARSLARGVSRRLSRDRQTGLGPGVTADSGGHGGGTRRAVGARRPRFTAGASGIPRAAGRCLGPSRVRMPFRVFSDTLALRSAEIAIDDTMNGFMTLFSPRSHPCRRGHIAPCAVLSESSENPLDGRAAHVRACASQVGVAKSGREILNGRKDHSGLCAVSGCQFAGPTSEFTVGAEQHHAEKVFQPRQQVVRALVPPQNSPCCQRRHCWSGAGVVTMHGCANTRCEEQPAGSFRHEVQPDIG